MKRHRLACVARRNRNLRAAAFVVVGFAIAGCSGSGTSGVQTGNDAGAGTSSGCSGVCAKMASCAQWSSDVCTSTCDYKNGVRTERFMSSNFCSANKATRTAEAEAEDGCNWAGLPPAS